LFRIGPTLSRRRGTIVIVMMHAASLTDDALTVELARLAGREREATTALIVHWPNSMPVVSTGAGS
jgi:hypothetical protein